MKFGDKENVDEGRYGNDTHQLCLEVAYSTVRTSGGLDFIQNSGSLMFSVQTVQRVRSSEVERVFSRIREGQSGSILLRLKK